MLLNHGVLVYLDDILFYLHDIASHCELLHKVFSLLVKYKLFIKESKYNFYLDSVEYIRYIIDEESMHIENRKINAMLV